MASLVLGAVGAGIGSMMGAGTLFGMTYTALGWNIGSLLGGYLFGPKMPTQYQYGPRLGDLKVQTSTYGNAIPVFWGATRVAGNMIWSTAILETATTTSQSSGGKGGGGQTTVSTTYTYSQSFAIALGEGEITGIRKIWANGELIYNLSDTATIDTIIASNRAASGIRIYTGSETQMADSLIQANIGAADTPAYRGTVYIVFENLQLANYGNQTPNLEFEAIKAGSQNYTNYYLPTVPNYPGTLNSDVVSIPAISELGDPIEIYVGQWDADYIGHDVKVYQINNNAYFLKGTLVATSNNTFASGGVSDTAGFLNQEKGASAIYYWQALGEITQTFILPESLGAGQVQYAKEGAQFYFSSTGFGSKKIYARGPIFAESQPLANFCTIAIDGTYIYCLELATPSKLTRLLRSDLSLVDSITLDFAATNFYSSKIRISPDGKIYVFYENQILLITGGTSTIVASGLVSFSPFFSVGSDESIIFSNFPDPITGRYCATRVMTKVITSSSTALSSIVADICIKTGLTAGEIDVSQLTDIVDGYVVQRGTARSWLEQLMMAFFFDAVESDGKVKFVKRGGSSVAAIVEDDLAAHEYGSSPPDTLTINRKQEMELPVEMAVQYMDTGAAYAIGSQEARRLITDSQNQQSINLAISMTGTKARQISEVLMYDAWTTRTTFDAWTGWKYSYLEPTDVITFTKGGRTYTTRLVDEDAAAGIFRRTAVLEDAGIYTQTPTAAPITVPPDTVSSVPLTDMILMDIPLLRDQDDGLGFYAAACGYVEGWHGAQAYKSNDDGLTWSSYGRAFLNEAAIGAASGVLGNFYGGNIFDELNSITVVMINGTLASDTEINVLNGANVALLGDEIIQYKTATLTATDTYLLTGLLRGRRGTEWAMATHVTGERFVVLSETTTYLFDASSAEYDLARNYKGVSFGGYLDEAPTITFTHTAMALHPYAPVLLGGGRNTALDVILTWTRRTRTGGAWNNYSDVPIGETTEAYEVEIWNSGYTVLKRTITGITSATTTYSAAQQTTDFGSAQSTVYFKVYQISAVVGRGFEARGQA